MAHAAKIGQLTGELVQCVTSKTADDAAFKQLHDQATKELRGASHARTNQFDVQSRLDGLVEKFAVLNRDDLSVALQERVDELPTKSKWMPEILSLLLHLSDRPLEKTKIEDVEALANATDDQQPVLTWQDIIDADPLDEEGIWDDVERGYHSSGDEATVEGDSDDTVSTQATSIHEDDTFALARLHLIQLDDSNLDAVREAREALHADGQRARVSELTTIRETLSMLHGLPSHLYHVDEAAGKVTPNARFHLDTASPSVDDDVLMQCASIGTSLNTLRRWNRISRSKAYLQSCQASIQQLMMNFGSRLAELEQQYLMPATDTTVSILDIRSQVDKCAKPFLRLSSIVQSAERQSKEAPFVLLDQLYDAICAAQMSGDAQLSDSLSAVFFAGLKTYLKPVSVWMQSGFLDTKDDDFLVEEANPSCTLGSLWISRYAVRLLPNGRPSAPAFMKAFVDKIFAIGKSQAFLQALNENTDADRPSFTRPILDFTSLETQVYGNSLQPFSETLAQCLHSWISETGKDCAPTLHKTLLHERGLRKTLAGLNDTFCSKNGTVFQAFAESLFRRMDSRSGNWNDRFVLTELVQSTIGSANEVDAHSLSISLDKVDERDASASLMKQLQSFRLETVFSWPIQNITCCHSPAAYTKAFTILLQVYRAKHLLRRQLLDLRTFDSRTNRPPTEIRNALQLRQRLVTLVDVLHTHITDVAHTLNRSMLTKIETADGIDAMAEIYAEHIKELETSLLLAENLKPVRASVDSLLTLCERFARVWQENVTSTEVRGGSERVDSSTNDDNCNERSTEEQVSELRKELDKSLSFLKAGLRGIGRAGGNTALEVLAERLE